MSKQIERIRQGLVSVLAEIEVNIDYPEYESELVTADVTMKTLNSVIIELEDLSKSYRQGRLIREGLKITIAGIPNVGKSSLMNALTGYNRAIVSSIPGTTRDTIEEYIEIDGIPVILTDTAGIRETEDVIEQIGVKRAEEKIEEADIVIYMIDSTEPDIEEKILSIKKPLIVILNKIDIETNYLEELGRKLKNYDVIETSLTEDIGVKEVFDRIKKYFSEEKIGINTENIITNARHKTLIDTSLASLKKAVENYNTGMPLDIIAHMEWREYFRRDYRGFGKRRSIEQHFSRFCLGK